MKVKLVSIPVRDQQKAADFYVDKLGFVIKVDTPISGDNRWLTVVPKDDQDGVQILLEPAPNHFEPAKVFQEALFDSGMPWTQLYVDDIQADYQRLSKKGVEFRVEPKDVGEVIFAIFDDTCGNYIQLVEEK